MFLVLYKWLVFSRSLFHREVLSILTESHFCLGMYVLYKVSLKGGYERLDYL